MTSTAAKKSATVRDSTKLYIQALTFEQGEQASALEGVEEATVKHHLEGTINEDDFIDVIININAARSKLAARVCNAEQPQAGGGASTEGGSDTSGAEVRRVPKRKRGGEDGAPASVRGSGEETLHRRMEAEAGIEPVPSGEKDGIAEECSRLLHEGGHSTSRTLGIRGVYRIRTGKAFRFGGSGHSGSFWEETEGLAGGRGHQAVYPALASEPLLEIEGSPEYGTGLIAAHGGSGIDRADRMWQDEVGEGALPRGLLDSPRSVEVVGQVRGPRDDSDRRIRLGESGLQSPFASPGSIWAPSGDEGWIYNTPPQPSHPHKCFAPRRMVRERGERVRAATPNYEDRDGEATC